MSTNEIESMAVCPSFESCSAPLCPLDPGLADRIWYSDEPVCFGRAGAGCRWIKKQRSIVRRNTQSWLDRPITQQELYAASRPKQLSDEQKAVLRDRLANARSSNA